MASEKLTCWVEAADLGLGWEPDPNHRLRRGVPAATWRDLRAKLAAAAARCGPRRPDALERNARAFAAHVAPNENEALI